MPYNPADIRIRVDRARAALRIGQAAVVTITRRAMDDGRGVNDRPHKPYTPRYAAHKQHTGHVDLTVTGRMRRSVRTEMQGETARISLRGSGKPDYAIHTNARRPWFGLSPKDRVVLRPIVTRVLGQSMQPPKGAR